MISILITWNFLVSPPPGDSYTQVLWTWIDVAGFRPQIAFYLDALSLIMTLVVTFVSFLIHLYSAESMMESEGYSPLLRLHELVRRFDGDVAAGRQSAAALPRVGRRRTVQLPADRLLVRATR